MINKKYVHHSITINDVYGIYYIPHTSFN